MCSAALGCFMERPHFDSSCAGAGSLHGLGVSGTHSARNEEWTLGQIRCHSHSRALVQWHSHAFSFRCPYWCDRRIPGLGYLPCAPIHIHDISRGYEFTQRYTGRPYPDRLCDESTRFLVLYCVKSGSPTHSGEWAATSAVGRERNANHDPFTHRARVRDFAHNSGARSWCSSRLGGHLHIHPREETPGERTRTITASRLG